MGCGIRATWAAPRSRPFSPCWPPSGALRRPRTSRHFARCCFSTGRCSAWNCLGSMHCIAPPAPAAHPRGAHAGRGVRAAHPAGRSPAVSLLPRLLYGTGMRLMEALRLHVKGAHRAGIAGAQQREHDHDLHAHGPACRGRHGQPARRAAAGPGQRGTTRRKRARCGLRLAPGCPRAAGARSGLACTPAPKHLTC